MRLLPGNSSILRVPCVPFNFDDPPFDVIEYGRALAKLMRDSKGLGLSANQVADETNFGGSLRYRIFVMRADPNIVCINPRVVSASTNLEQLEEGCLSFPGLLVKVKRPKVCRVRFQQPNGETVTEQYIGMAARVFQHELSHLNGEAFFKEVSRLRLDMSIRKAKKLGFDYSFLPTLFHETSQQSVVS